MITKKSLVKTIGVLVLFIVILLGTLLVNNQTYRSNIQDYQQKVKLYEEQIQYYNNESISLRNTLSEVTEYSEALQEAMQELQTESMMNLKYIGEFKITYYCACEKCCGSYAKTRPVVNNKKVVYTASGAFAQDGITVAVDPNVIPYGTLLYIDGVGYRIAQDSGSAIKGNKIDVYTGSHEAALKGGYHTSKIYIVDGGFEND